MKTQKLIDLMLYARERSIVELYVGSMSRNDAGYYKWARRAEFFKRELLRRFANLNDKLGETSMRVVELESYENSRIHRAYNVTQGSLDIVLKIMQEVMAAPGLEVSSRVSAASMKLAERYAELLDTYEKKYRELEERWHKSTE